MSKPTAPHSERRPVAYLNEEFLNSPDARALAHSVRISGAAGAFPAREDARHGGVLRLGADTRTTARWRSYYDDARKLARMLTEWAQQFTNSTYRFVVCSGGGPGIMEAANRGAADAGGKTIGLNIGLPFEQFPNPYITPELSFEFHYFFMRKFWFAYLAKALVVFPGGFGTLDEMIEILTLAQTQKLAKKMTVLLYGTSTGKRSSTSTRW